MGSHIVLRNYRGHICIAHGGINWVAMIMLHHGGAILGTKGLEVELHGIAIRHADVEELLEVVIAGGGNVLILAIPGGRVDHSHRRLRKGSSRELSETPRLAFALHCTVPTQYYGTEKECPSLGFEACPQVEGLLARRGQMSRLLYSLLSCFRR